jgi:hypothetical protein
MPAQIVMFPELAVQPDAMILIEKPAKLPKLPKGFKNPVPGSFEVFQVWTWYAPWGFWKHWPRIDTMERLNHWLAVGWFPRGNTHYRIVRIKEVA